MFNTYASIMASEPTMFQNATLATMSAIAGPIGAGIQLFGTTSNLIGNWTGSAQQAQGSEATGLLGQGQQILTAFTQGQQIINGGAQQLQNAKARLVMITKAATTQGFFVMPSGKVILSKPQWDAIAALHAANHHGAARTLQADLLRRAGEHTAQIDLVVLQTNAADAQVALTLANSAASILGSLIQKEPKTEVPTQTDTTAPLPPTTVGPRDPVTPATIAGGTPPTGIGTGLASAGALGGAGATGLGLNGAGAAGLNPAALSGTAGLTGTVAGRGGLAGEVAGGRGGSAMGPGMMYGGAGMGGGHLGDKEEREGSEWLEEDGESWQTAEAATDAGGVLS